MEKLYDIISVPMGYILSFLSGLVGNNFAAAVFLFTIIANLAMIPLTIKSQKSSVQQMRIKPRLDEIKKRCGDDKQRYTQEMQELYQKENVSMSGGCLPLILRMVFMMGIYSVVINPLRYICGVSASTIDAALKSVEGLSKNARAIELIPYVEKGLVDTIKPEVLANVDFNFFGINLTQQPNFSLDFSKAELIWIIPFMAFAAQMLSSIVSLKIQKIQNPDAPNMSGMMLTMPLISLFIGFGFPGALGFYWACSAIIGGAIQTIISLKFGPNVILAKERIKETYTRFKSEQNRKKSAQID